MTDMSTEKHEIYDKLLEFGRHYGMRYLQVTLLQWMETQLKGELDAERENSEWRIK